MLQPPRLNLSYGANVCDDTVVHPSETGQLCDGVLAPSGCHGFSFLGFGVLVKMKIRGVSQY